ncbi:hypothetical protein [Clostridium sp.]|jgi:hypothetical protein|uniref:hypothetical protein n=1 Tax=Clostridium sp. TaxID=1506 RepID=UPI003EEBDEC1
MHLKLLPSRTLVTPTELYELSSKPNFVGQSGADDHGEYSMIWDIDGKEYQTNNVL